MAESKSVSAGSVSVECIIPILNVHDLKASIRFYVDVLGFKVDWGGDDSTRKASVSRDGKVIMLCPHDRGHPGTWIWIGVEDIEPLFEQYRAKGAKVRQQPTNHSWAYEMRIEDPAGHVPRFGSEPKK